MEEVRSLRCPKEIEEVRSVNSPRRTLSFSKNRRGTISFPDDKASGFGVSGEHGPKPLEVYGFVGSISTVVATGVIQLSSFYYALDLTMEII